MWSTRPVLVETRKVEAVEGVDGGAVDTAQRLGDEGDDVVALGDGIGVVA